MSRASTNENASPQSRAGVGVRIAVVLFALLTVACLGWMGYTLHQITRENGELIGKVAGLETKMERLNIDVSMPRLTEVLIAQLVPLLSAKKVAPSEPPPPPLNRPRFGSLAVLPFSASSSTGVVDLKNEADNLHKAFHGLLGKELKLGLVPADKVDAELKGKRVRGLGGSMAAADPPDAIAPATLARRLGVDAVLTGDLTNTDSMSLSGQSRVPIRFRIQLVEASTGLTAWAEEYFLEQWNLENYYQESRKPASVGWTRELASACRKAAEVVKTFAVD